MMAWKAWLIAAGIFLLIEILPPPTHFAALCLALGALAASILAFFVTAAWVPWVVFIVTSAVLVPFLMPLARFLFTPKSASAVEDKDDGK